MPRLSLSSPARRSRAVAVAATPTGDGDTCKPAPIVVAAAAPASFADRQKQIQALKRRQENRKTVLHPFAVDPAALPLDELHPLLVVADWAAVPEDNVVLHPFHPHLTLDLIPSDELTVMRTRSEVPCDELVPLSSGAVSRSPAHTVLLPFTNSTVPPPSDEDDEEEEEASSILAHKQLVKSRLVAEQESRLRDILAHKQHVLGALEQRAAALVRGGDARALQCVLDKKKQLVGKLRDISLTVQQDTLAGKQAVLARLRAAAARKQ